MISTRCLKINSSTWSLSIRIVNIMTRSKNIVRHRWLHREEHHEESVLYDFTASSNRSRHSPWKFEGRRLWNFETSRHYFHVRISRATDESNQILKRLRPRCPVLYVRERALSRQKCSAHHRRNCLDRSVDETRESSRIRSCVRPERLRT